MALKTAAQSHVRTIKSAGPASNSQRIEWSYAAGMFRMLTFLRSLNRPARLQ